MGPYGWWCWGYYSLDGARPRDNLDEACRWWCWGYYSLDGARRGGVLGLSRPGRGLSVVVLGLL